MAGAFLIISVALTSALSGVFGMAGGLLLKGALLFIYPVAGSMVIHGILQGFANLTRAWIHRKLILSRESLLSRDFKGAMVLIATTILVTLSFMAISWRPSVQNVYLVMGIIPLGSLALKKRLMLSIQNPIHAVMLGILVQGAQLTSGVSGPVLDLAFLSMSGSPQFIVGMKSLVMITGHLQKVFVYSPDFFGMIQSTGKGTEIARDITLAFVASLMGTSLGTRILTKISDRAFRTYSSWIIGLIGAYYLLYALFGDFTN